MIQIAPQYLTARQASDYLGIAYVTLRKDYKSWFDLGVNPSRYGGKNDSGHLRFKRSELDHLMDQWRLVKA